MTGATSAVGKDIVRSLLERGTRVRAMVYDKEKAENMAVAGAEVVVGDMRSEEDVSLALNGVDKIYLITPLAKDMVDVTKLMIEIAEREGVRKIVRQSVIDCGVDRSFEFWKKHRECEEVVRRSMMEHTNLRLNQLMQNFVKFNGRTIKEQGLFRKPCGEGRTSFVDALDVAASAAVILDGNWHDGKTYTLTGPEPISNPDVAFELTRALNKEVRYEDVEMSKARATLIDEGLDTWLVDGMMEMYEVEKGDLASVVTNDVERLTGARPRTFTQFALHIIPAFM